MALLEKQFQEMKKKYDESESSRKKLAYELEYLTKRLKICDAEIEHLNKRENVIMGVQQSGQTQPLQSTTKLSTSDQEILREV